MICTRHRKNGQPCRGQAIDGTDACRVHAGRALAEQKARGEVVVTLRRWGVDDLPEEPGLLLLKLMTVTSWRQQEYEDEINRVLTETGLSRSEALVGDSMVVDKDGSPHKVGEYIRGIVQLEQSERKLAAELAIKALAAGVAERQTRLAEQEAHLVVDFLRGVLAELGHDPADPLVARVVSTRMRILAGVA